jgi:hypothetical protein
VIKRPPLHVRYRANSGAKADIPAHRFVPIGDLSRCSNIAALSSLDNLVGDGEQFIGHGEAEHLGGVEIDDKLELANLLHR